MARPTLYVRELGPLVGFFLSFLFLAVQFPPVHGLPQTILTTETTALRDIPFSLVVGVQWRAAEQQPYLNYTLHTAEGVSIAAGEISTFTDDHLASELTIEGAVLSSVGTHNLNLCLSDHTGEKVCATVETYVLMGWLTLIPAALMLILSVITKQVHASLFAGIFMCSMLVKKFNPVTAFVHTMDNYLVGAVASEDHAFIILFTLFLAGAIAIITKSKGGEAFARLISGRARTRESAQRLLYFTGWLIFFDDYANTLILGSTFRPIMEALKVSPEKFAFLVDCTSAPIASIAPISGWIGFELSLIAESFKLAGLPNEDSYGVFMETLPSRFYPMLMLIFTFMLLMMGVDFGPMLTAERAAAGIRTGRTRPSPNEGSILLDSQQREDSESNNELNDDDARKIRDNSQESPMVAVEVEAAPAPVGRVSTAVVPILVMLLTVLVGMLLTGYNKLSPDDPATLLAMFSNAESFGPLLWGAFMASVTAMILVAVYRIFTLRKAIEIWVNGMKEILEAILILIFAWGVGAGMTEAGTAQYLVNSLSHDLPPEMLPATVSFLSCIISFCTGTSWGTMAILFPLVVPLAQAAGGGDRFYVIHSIAAILAGSIFGDHCTPVSDTTILSCVATRCDLRRHVNTQLPYALVVGVIGLFFGDLATGYRWYPSWLALMLGSGILFVVLVVVGRTPNDRRPDCFTSVRRCLGRERNVVPDNQPEEEYAIEPTQQQQQYGFGGGSDRNLAGGGRTAKVLTSEDIPGGHLILSQSIQDSAFLVDALNNKEDFDSDVDALRGRTKQPYYQAAE